MAASLARFARSAPVRPDGLAGDLREIDVRRERLAARVHLEDLLAAGEIGRRDEHLPVEPAGAQQRRVEVLETVRRPHHHDLVGGAEAVELDEQLVERLVLLAVEAVAGAGGADGVELVDEDDRGRVLARLVEELADPRGAEAGEHLHERGGGLRVERRAGLVRDRLGEQRLAGTGRAVEEDPLRHARAEPLEALGIAQEVDHLGELGLRLLGAGDVAPGDRGARVRLDVLRLDPRHQRHGAPEQVDDQAEEDDRQPGQRLLPDLVKRLPDGGDHPPHHRQRRRKALETR